MCAIQRTVLLTIAIFVLVPAYAAAQESSGGKSKKPVQTKKEQDGTAQGKESGLKKVTDGMLGFLGERMDELGKSVEAVIKGGTQLLMDAVPKRQKTKQNNKVRQKAGTEKEKVK